MPRPPPVMIATPRAGRAAGPGGGTEASAEACLEDDSAARDPNATIERAARNMPSCGPLRGVGRTIDGLFQAPGELFWLAVALAVAASSARAMAEASEPIAPADLQVRTHTWLTDLLANLTCLRDPRPSQCPSGWTMLSVNANGEGCYQSRTGKRLRSMHEVQHHLKVNDTRLRLHIVDPCAQSA
jgi:hypothetical protein